MGDCSSFLDIFDVTAVVDTVKNTVSALPKSQAQLQDGNPDPNEPVTVLDVAAATDALKGSAYQFSGPAACPE